MNSTEKDNIIQKAICCSGVMGKTVADLYIKGSRCADKEFQKLFLLVSYTETLGCYQAPLEVTTYETEGEPITSAVFDVTIPCSLITSIPTAEDSVSLTINGITTSVQGDGISTFEELLFPLLNATGFTYNVTSAINCSSGDMLITITANCDTTDIIVTSTITVGPIVSSTAYTGVETTVGDCARTSLVTTVTTTEYTNCLTEDEADAIATQISKICDLCDEH